MSLSLKAHAQGRIVAALVGFFGGGFTFAMFNQRWDAGGFALALGPAMVLGSMYLAHLVFNQYFSAECPRCGADAVPARGYDLTAYVCTACGAESNALGALMGIGGTTRQETLAAAVAATQSPGQEKRPRSPMGYLFFVVGLIVIGIAIWLGQESIRLVREGVSTEARVVRVTHQPGSGANQDETQHIAFVEYKVDGEPRILERSWSATPGGWTWPNYSPGERLRVIYLPSEPGRAQIDTLPELFFAPSFLTLCGAGFIALGVLMLRYRRKPAGQTLQPRKEEHLAPHK